MKRDPRYSNRAVIKPATEINVNTSKEHSVEPAREEIREYSPWHDTSGKKDIKVKNLILKRAARQLNKI
jgi:hypothetical protein